MHWIVPLSQFLTNWNQVWAFVLFPVSWTLASPFWFQYPLKHPERPWTLGQLQTRHPPATSFSVLQRCGVSYVSECLHHCFLVSQIGPKYRNNVSTSSYYYHRFHKRSMFMHTVGSPRKRKIGTLLYIDICSIQNQYCRIRSNIICQKVLCQLTSVVLNDFFPGNMFKSN